MSTFAAPVVIGLLFELLGLQGALAAGLGSGLLLYGTLGLSAARRFRDPTTRHVLRAASGCALIVIAAVGTYDMPYGFGHWVTGSPGT